MDMSKKQNFLLQFFIAGFAALAYQIVSFKLISISGLSDAISVAISLTAFVTLSGLGSLLSYKIHQDFTGKLEIILGSFAIILFSTVIIWGVGNFASAFGGLSLHLKLLVFLTIISPLAFISGVLIPLHQRRLPTSNSSMDFSRFFLIYCFFHIGGFISLLLIELYAIVNIGWANVGIILGVISLVNGFFINRSSFSNKLISYSNEIDFFKSLFKKKQTVLFTLSIASGYVGIITYRLFDYLVEPNMRNYTVITALIFLSLSFSSIIAKRFNISFKGMIGFTGLGILCVFISGIVSPPLSIKIVNSEVSDWFIYYIAGALLIIPTYTLMGLSIPVSVKLGMPSNQALFIVSIGNALGYWAYIFTASYNVDAIIVIMIVGIIYLFTTMKIVIPMTALAVTITPFVYKMYHNSIHQIFLHNVVIHEQKMVDDFWKHISHFNFDSPSSKDLDYNFGIVESWNTYGWSVDHVYVETEKKETGEHYDRQEYYIISGSRSLSLEPPELVEFAESMVAAIPAFFVDNFNNALVLGSGSGISVKVAGHSFENTRVIDLSPDTESQLKHFSYVNDNVIDDVSIIKQDAFSYLMGKDSDETGYDYIFSTVTGSGYPMSALLYTKEFFEAGSRSLNDGGVFAFWMDRRAGKGAYNVMSSIKEVFPYVENYRVAPIKGYIEDILIPYQVIIASNNPLEISNNSHHVNEFMKEKFAKLKENLYQDTSLHILGDNLHDTQLLLNDRFVGGFGDLSNYRSSGINSLSFAYDSIRRYQIHQILLGYSEEIAEEERVAVEAEVALSLQSSEDDDWPPSDEYIDWDDDGESWVLRDGVWYYEPDEEE